jgi:YD repeat-containing protein
MKKIALVFLVTCFLAPHFAQAQKKTGQQQNGLNGLVQTIRTEEAEIEVENGQPVEGKRRLSSLETYDVNGQALVESYYDDEGEILYSETYVYDAGGHVIEQQTGHSPYLYLPDRKVFIYNAQGNVVEENGYDLQNKLLGKYTYAYDAQGNVIEWESLKLDESKPVYGNSLTRYRYDADGNRVENSTYQREGSGLKRYDFSIGYYKQIYLYDSKGRQVATNYYSLDEKLYRTSIDLFDNKDNVIESAEYNPDGTIHSRTRYDYEFDKHGNWTKQLTSEWVTEDGKSFFRPTEVDYRAITYFKSASKSVTKPAAAQPNVLQNTDAEDYSVYAAILNRYFEDEKIRLLVLKKFTEGYNTDEPRQRKNLTLQSFALKEVEPATLDDYVERNRNRHYQLLDRLFALKGQHALVTDGEMHEIFAKDCNKGWKAFYKKYPASQGTMTLSKVGYNREHTQALVYVGTQSLCLAGGGRFIILAKQNGAWQVMRENMIWIS